MEMLIDAAPLSEIKINNIQNWYVFCLKPLNNLNLVGNKHEFERKRFYPD